MSLLSTSSKQDIGSMPQDTKIPRSGIYMISLNLNSTDSYVPDQMLHHFEVVENGHLADECDEKEKRRIAEICAPGLMKNNSTLLTDILSEDEFNVAALVELIIAKADVKFTSEKSFTLCS